LSIDATRNHVGDYSKPTEPRQATCCFVEPSERPRSWYANSTRWQQEPGDIGLGVYNPSTGEIHVGSFDAYGGHDLFLQNLGITDAAPWRGFVVGSNGQASNNSGLNVGLGYGQGMSPTDYQHVVDELRQGGLIH
jgi:hypothetical protein